MTSGLDPRIERVATQLESSAAELDEISFDQLREAAADGAKVRPESDKALTQARRAVEKAVVVLRRLESGGADDNDFGDD